MKKSCLYFDKKFKCVSFIVHYKGLTLSKIKKVYGVEEEAKPTRASCFLIPVFVYILVIKIPIIKKPFLYLVIENQWTP